MTSGMTFREMNVRVFGGEPIPHVLFQPRFEPWYDWQKRFGSLPDRYRDLGLLGTYDELGCSMRYVHYYTEMPDPVIRKVTPEVPVRERRTADEIVRAVRNTLRRPGRDAPFHCGWDVARGGLPGQRAR